MWVAVVKVPVYTGRAKTMVKKAKMKRAKVKVLRAGTRAASIQLPVVAWTWGEGVAWAASRHGPPSQARYGVPVECFPGHFFLALGFLYCMLSLPCRLGASSSCCW